MLLKAKRSHWELSISQFVFFLTLAIIALYHFPLYTFVSENLELSTLHGVAVLLSVFCIIFLASLVLFSIIALLLPFLLKPFAVIISFLNAAAVYFLLTYQVVLDKTMMGNILNTKNEESLDFLSYSFLIYIVLLGLIPSLFILRTRIKKGYRVRLILQVIASVIIGGLFIYMNASSWLWIDKHAKTLGGKILPWSYIMNTARHYSEQSKASKIQQLLPLATFGDNEKEVVLLIIGETARAQNFSLNGYARKTNPLLENKKGLINFTDTWACSTYTTASVACILSHTDNDPSAFEPLPSYLNRHGVDVIWRTKNWGEPPIKVNEYLESGDLEATCKGDDCKFDGLLLTGLKQRIESSKQNKILVVLHTKGSHGPSYFTRYPKGFDVFKPICKSVELNKCTPQELQNAYDNSILYTDYFLNKTIDLLDNLEGIPSTLMYVSDHGESLGEFGLYLHGTPYSFAPDFQKKVPFMVWVSDDFQTLKSYKKIPTSNKEMHSQANIFHSVLGALGIDSEVYDSKLDVYRRFLMSD
ncbi:MAG: phosphoethanolamine--lipid A transferase EptA [Cocleimonas sp.]